MSCGCCQARDVGRPIVQSPSSSAELFQASQKGQSGQDNHVTPVATGCFSFFSKNSSPSEPTITPKNPLGGKAILPGGCVSPQDLIEASGSERKYKTILLTKLSQAKDMGASFIEGTKNQIEAHPRIAGAIAVATPIAAYSIKSYLKATAEWEIRRQSEQFQWDVLCYLAQGVSALGLLIFGFKLCR